MADSWAKPYDIAPMPVIISEAGGCFTDWQGAPGFDGGLGARDQRAHPLGAVEAVGARAMKPVREALVRRRDVGT